MDSKPRVLEHESKKVEEESGIPCLPPALSVPSISIEVEAIEDFHQRSDSHPTNALAQNSQSRSLSISDEMGHAGRRRSAFHQMIQTSLSEGARLNEEKAMELEERLKKLVSAFTTRTRKTVLEIKRPPTPSSDESEAG